MMWAMDALGDPPASSFASDNAAGVLPEVLDALVQANEGPALAYGDDPWTARLRGELQDRFDAPVEVLPCWGGTGANIVGLAALLAPWQALVCPDTAHVVVDEAGGPARFTGASVLPVATADGRLRPEQLDRYLGWQGAVHHPQPAAISVSQATEEGTVYGVDELGALCEAAHANDLAVHLDGARLANALVATGADLAAMVTRTGVDVLTLGATKAGGMYGEVVVLLRPELAGQARFHHKQAGQLPSKARFVAAQLLALLDEDRWVTGAAHANAMADRLADAVADIPGVDLVRRPEVNSVFARIPEAAVAPLQAWSPFWPWSGPAGTVRWMTSWATTPEDIDRFAGGVRTVVGSHLV